MDDTISVNLTVNGKAVTSNVPTRASLLRFLGQKKVTSTVTNRLSLMRFLREDLRLTGTKNGCGTNHCGSCMVLVNGKPEKSCLLQVRTLENADIVTIEGLSETGALHPIQAAFLAAGGIQCGFCIPGMIMATKALLDSNPDPGDAEIRRALSDVVCRCAAYGQIIDGVKLSARWLKNPEEMAVLASGGLNHSVMDIDGVAKAQGTQVYGDDVLLEDMLYLKAVWSAHPHAIIKGIDTGAAEEVPGVLRVLTASDVPGHNGFGSIKPDQPVLCLDRVRFIGDAVAVVVAESEDIAEKARDLIRVDYEPLPGLFSPADSLREDAPLLFPDGNVCTHLVHAVGDVERGLAEADLVVEGHFETPFIEHAYTEPEAGVAYWEGDVLTLRVPAQSPFELRTQMASAMALPEEKVRIIIAPIGGAFGGKLDSTVEPLLALAAYCTGRAVKMTLTRGESLIRSTKRHAYSMEYRVGLTSEGKILTVDAKLLSDAGAYTDLSPRTIDQACIFACGPYEVPHLRVEGWAVYTNNVKGGAFRGFGINQAAFSLESLLDEAARKLGIDPFDLRHKNGLKAGSETATGQILRESVALQETVAAARAALEEELPGIRKMVTPGCKLGIGVASAFKNVGAGKGKVDDAGATFTLLPGGKVELRVSAVDYGQGIRTTMAQITREVVPLGDHSLEVISGDTALTHRHAGAVAERQTLINGRAVQEAAKLFRDALLAAASSILELPAEELALTADAVSGPASGDGLTLAEVEQEMSRREERVQSSYVFVGPRTFALADVAGRKSVPREEYRNFPAYAYTTQACALEVDPKTGKVKVLRVFAAHDVGRAINPQKIEGQIEGSCLMAQGYALSEDFPVERGWPKARTYHDLKVPTILEAPVVRTLIVEKPDPIGPFGAKGISEVATVPLTPAITNGIYDAVGVRIYDLPATPAKVLTGIRRL